MHQGKKQRVLNTTWDGGEILLSEHQKLRSVSKLDSKDSTEFRFYFSPFPPIFLLFIPKKGVL